MRTIKWRWDYSVYMCFCPYCDEPAYEKDKCVACGFAFATGGLCEKAKEIAEWNRNVRFLEQAHEALTDFVAELKKAEENRPFKEFDTPIELPFEEVRNKEN